MRGADLVVATLKEAGVDAIFSLSGNQIMPVYDACIDAQLPIYHVRHEAAAVYMAEAYAQLTGTIGVALVTAAPGFAASLGPLVTSRASETPVLLLSGDSPVAQDGKGAFQELDQTAMSRPVTKFSARPTTSAALGADLATAIRTSQEGRPGPVHIALPFDLLNAETQSTTHSLEIERQPLEAKSLEAVLDSLARADRPVVLTGPSHNRSRAGDKLSRLEQALAVPVIPMESPRGLNDPGMGRLARIIGEADLIVSIGKPFDFTLGFGKSVAETCQVIAIDPDQAVLDQTQDALADRLLSAHLADMGLTLDALAKGHGAPDRSDWQARVAAALDERVRIDEGTGAMHPATLCEIVQNVLQAEADPILISDGGEFGQWVQAGITAPTRIINGPSGCIGGSIGYAFAAKIARPNATVVALMGDGTAGFHFAELETAHRYGADFIAIVGNDAKWNAEVEIQKREYGADRIYETELNETRYDKAAAGFGCHGFHADTPEQLQAALEEARSRNKSDNKSGKKPAVINVPITGVPAPTLTGQSGH